MTNFATGILAVAQSPLVLFLAGIGALVGIAYVAVLIDETRGRDLWLSLLPPTDKSGRVDEYLRRVKETR